MQNGLIPTENDDLEDGGAPAIDIPKLFGENADMPIPFEPAKNNRKSNSKCY